MITINIYKQYQIDKMKKDKNVIQIGSEIFEGNVNYLKSKMRLLDEQIESTGEKRLQICQSCELFNNFICDKTKYTVAENGDIVNGCGCNLKKKVLSTTSECPLGKW